MNAIDIACRHVYADGNNCGAQGGEKCRREVGSDTVIQFETYFHAERIEDASAITSPDATVTAQQFDAAVERILF